MLNELSIVIPAYNEAGNIEALVADIESKIPSSIKQYEVIIVDDGSTDDTYSIIKGLSAKNKNISCVRHADNRGMGASLITGFGRARMEWILHIDADNQVHITELSVFLPYAGHYDMIVGYRAHRRDARSRRFFSWWYNKLITCALGLRVKDVNCPFKLFKRSILNDVELHAQGFLAGAEILSKTFSRHYRIKELPVASHVRQKGVSTVRFHHVVETVKELVQMMTAERHK